MHANPACTETADRQRQERPPESHARRKSHFQAENLHVLQVKFCLHQEQGIDNAGPSDVYLSLIDPNGYPLTILPRRQGRLRLQPA